MSQIGDKIKALRKKKSLTLEGLAKEAGCSKSYVWELENSQTAPNPTREKLTGLALALDVTLDYLLDEESTEEEAQDKLFYRRYREMNPENKEKLRKLIEVWDD